MKGRNGTERNRTLPPFVYTQQAGQAEEQARQAVVLKQGVGLALALSADVFSPNRIMTAIFDFPAYGTVANFHQKREGGRCKNEPGGSASCSGKVSEAGGYRHAEASRQ